jgi:hypothetical protein
MASSFSVTNFKENIKSLVRPNYFEANLYGYTKVVGGLDGTLESIDSTFSFRCEKAEFPGRSLATVDDAVGGGPTLKLPYDVTYNDITLSIICSEDMKERTFFENWMDRIIGAAGDRFPGLVSYYEDYALGIGLSVKQFDAKGTSIFSYMLYDIYPIAISPMNAAWEETNTYQRFGVTIAYRYHKYSVYDVRAS